MPDLFDLMNSVESSDRTIELEGLINQARHDYYNGTPTVDDETYDAWVDELSELKADSLAVTAIGAPPPQVSEWKKVAHSIPMGSLSKINTVDELTSWLSGSGGSPMQSILVTEKLDGISLAVEYVNGAFSRALTRGDGFTGEDISVNAVKMKGIPGRLKDSVSCVLRGEVVLKKSDHMEHFPQYANPRNAASGLSKRYDGAGSEHLTVMFYQVADGPEFASEGEQFQWLEKMELLTPNWYVTAMIPGVRTPQDLWLEYQQFKRDELDYEIDGLVVRLDDMASQMALGEVDNRPKGAVAFKFAPMTRESVLQRIDWQVGGSGRVTPVAVFQPVRVLGAEITNASLYNIAYIRTLGLDVGSKILIARAQDVIPRVVAVRKGTGTVAEPPVLCPACKSKLEMEGEYLVCGNTALCPAQAVGRIKRYLSGMNIKEWGDVLIEKLVSQGLVKGVPDLYRLNASQLASMDRMGIKSAAKVMDTLREKSTVSLETLLGSLSIPLCGVSTVKMATSAGFDTLEKLRSVSAEQLAMVEGLGPVKATALWRWLQESSDVVEELLSLGVSIEEKKHGIFSGKTVCFTGSSDRPRAELQALVEQHGGEVKKSVTKKLTYLVMDDPNSGTVKARAAKKNGTACISEAEFLEMVGE